MYFKFFDCFLFSNVKPNESDQRKVDRNLKSVNAMWITGTITAKQKVRQEDPGLYAV